MVLFTHLESRFDDSVSGLVLVGRWYRTVKIRDVWGRTTFFSFFQFWTEVGKWFADFSKPFADFVFCLLKLKSPNGFPTSSKWSRDIIGPRWQEPSNSKYLDRTGHICQTFSILYRMGCWHISCFRTTWICSLTFLSCWSYHTHFLSNLVHWRLAVLFWLIFWL